MALRGWLYCLLNEICVCCQEMSPSTHTHCARRLSVNLWSRCLSVASTISQHHAQTRVMSSCVLHEFAGLDTHRAVTSGGAYFATGSHSGDDVDIPIRSIILTALVKTWCYYNCKHYLPLFSVVITVASRGSPQPCLVLAEVRKIYADSGLRSVAVNCRTVEPTSTVVNLLGLLFARR